MEKLGVLRAGGWQVLGLTKDRTLGGCIQEAFTEQIYLSKKISLKQSDHNLIKHP
jgi:hypothetical protein